jgi:uncharacterized protein YcbK (DUF882 family)
MKSRRWTRRQLSLTAVAPILALPLIRVAYGRATRDPEGQRRLELTNLHDGGRLTVRFHDEHDMLPDAAAALRHLLRDYRVSEEHDMDFGLFMQLTDLARECAVPARYEVISGYRSPATNAKLHAAGHGVAEHSQHMEGRAIDVRLKDCPLVRLHEAALAAKRGGVGYYPRSNFVHIDTGRLRSWQE